MRKYKGLAVCFQCFQKKDNKREERTKGRKSQPKKKQGKKVFGRSPHGFLWFSLGRKRSMDWFINEIINLMGSEKSQ